MMEILFYSHELSCRDQQEARCYSWAGSARWEEGRENTSSRTVSQARHVLFCSEHRSKQAWKLSTYPWKIQGCSRDPTPMLATTLWPGKLDTPFIQQLFCWFGLLVSHTVSTQYLLHCAESCLGRSLSISGPRMCKKLSLTVGGSLSVDQHQGDTQAHFPCQQKHVEGYSRVFSSILKHRSRTSTTSRAGVYIKTWAISPVHQHHSQEVLQARPQQQYSFLWILPQFSGTKACNLVLVCFLLYFACSILKSRTDPRYGEYVPAPDTSTSDTVTNQRSPFYIHTNSAVTHSQALWDVANPR